MIFDLILVSVVGFLIGFRIGQSEAFDDFF